MELTTEQLKPFHVQEWVDGKISWSGGMKRGALIAVQRAFNWAVRSGHLDRSPVAHLEKPAAYTAARCSRSVGRVATLFKNAGRSF